MTDAHDKLLRRLEDAAQADVGMRTSSQELFHDAAVEIERLRGSNKQLADIVTDQEDRRLKAEARVAELEASAMQVINRASDVRVTDAARNTFRSVFHDDLESLKEVLTHAHPSRD